VHGDEQTLATRKIPPAAGVAAGVIFLIVSGCRAHSPGSGERAADSADTITIGFGLNPGADPHLGVQSVTGYLAVENLLDVPPDGKPTPSLAESWSTSEDGLTLRLRLAAAKFHDGTPANAQAVREILLAQLPSLLGPAFDDIDHITATSDRDIQFSLKRPSGFLLESLHFSIRKPNPTEVIGSGPFRVSGQIGDSIELRANADYHGGKPYLQRVLITPYNSIRSAWADMLRGRVDMLYEVGTDAIASLQPSSSVRVIAFDRPYAYLVLLNTRKPLLRDPKFRRGLNDAIDRQALVSGVLGGHATAADTAVRPRHWAYDAQLPRFKYEPRVLVAGPHKATLSCLFADPSFEKIALFLQKELDAVGIDLRLEQVTVEQFRNRGGAGDFDALLGDFPVGSALARQYLFWHSGGPINWGQFRSSEVDAALDAVRHASNDAAYKAGFAAFDRAMVNDPPAIFLAWGQRIRAVSRKFWVPEENGRDVLNSLRLWRPATAEQAASQN
jgi:peptide/nickel transport system substrate-binding protein